MAILLTIQLNSFYQVWIVISAIFLSTAGVYLGLTITQTPMSFLFTNLGIIALAGIVVNNNIVLVDTFNRLRRENENISLKEVIIKTASQRLETNNNLNNFDDRYRFAPFSIWIRVDLLH